MSIDQPIFVTGKPPTDKPVFVTKSRLARLLKTDVRRSKVADRKSDAVLVRPNGKEYPLFRVIIK
jgi:hypothetical protein